MVQVINYMQVKNVSDARHVLRQNCPYMKFGWIYESVRRGWGVQRMSDPPPSVRTLQAPAGFHRGARHTEKDGILRGLRPEVDHRGRIKIYQKASGNLLG